jgi:hypothetical protein
MRPIEAQWACGGGISGFQKARNEQKQAENHSTVSIFVSNRKTEIRQSQK